MHERNLRRLAFVGFSSTLFTYPLNILRLTLKEVVQTQRILLLKAIDNQCP